MSAQQQQIKVKFPESLQGGVYANHMYVSHTREEFILDFLMVAPPAGTITSRVLTSPGHMKRIIRALQDNVKKYENQFGKITEAKEPKSISGFHASPQD